MKITAISNYAIKPQFKGSPIQKNAIKAEIGTKQAKNFKGYAACFALGALAIFGLNKINTSIKNFNNAKPITIEKREDENIYETLDKISRTCNISDDFIMAFNDEFAHNPIEESEKIIIPKKYDYLQEKIEKLEKELYNNPENFEEINYRIERLQRKKIDQDYYGQICYDQEGNVYIYLNKSAISFWACDFMKLFDVDKKAIEKWLTENNKYPFIYDVKENTAFRDFEEQEIPKGQIIRLKKEDIGNVIYTDFIS